VRNNQNSDTVILNTVSPYYVHPNENPAISLATIIILGRVWCAELSWARSFLVKVDNVVSAVSKVTLLTHATRSMAFSCLFLASSSKLELLCKDFARQRKLPFSLSNSRATNLFDLVHHSLPSFQGYKYFLTIVDDYSQFTWAILLKHKSEVKTEV